MLSYISNLQTECPCLLSVDKNILEFHIVCLELLGNLTKEIKEPIAESVDEKIIAPPLRMDSVWIGVSEAIEAKVTDVEGVLKERKKKLNRIFQKEI